jgi:SAM-dependent methyltransferase
MSHSNVTIHEVVRERYGSIAAGISASCCSADSASARGTSEVQLYDSALLADLPETVTNVSLGCGDPVSIASLKPGEVVLDLGSGGGIDCFLAARQVGDTGFVIGVDMTPEMLARAEDNKSKMGINNVEFRRGNIEALPVDDSSIDVIMSNCVINLSPDKLAVFAEALRVLKPGGRISVSDIVIEGEFTPEMRADFAQWAECVTGAIDIDTYTGIMRDVGFVNIQVVDKGSAEGIVERRPGMPRIFSARITANKP